MEWKLIRCDSSGFSVFILCFKYSYILEFFRYTVNIFIDLICYAYYWLILYHMLFTNLSTFVYEMCVVFQIARIICMQGRNQDFKLEGGAYLKKLRRAEGGANIFGVFRVKNHDFTPKNLIFSNFRGARAGSAPGMGHYHLHVSILYRYKALHSLCWGYYIYICTSFNRLTTWIY
jgi:hypothetical protein